MKHCLLWITGLALAQTHAATASEAVSAKPGEVRCAVYDAHGVELVPDTAISSTAGPYSQSLVAQGAGFRYQVDLLDGVAELALSDRHASDARSVEDLALGETVSLSLRSASDDRLYLRLSCTGF